MKTLFIIAGIVIAVWFVISMFIAIKAFNEYQKAWKKSEKIRNEIREEMIKLKRPE